MSDEKFNLLVPTLVYKPQPYGGPRSSADLNDFMDCAISDLYTVISVLNKKIIPILNGLPLAEYEEELNAIVDGLTAASLYIGTEITSDSLHADYYYRTSPSPERITTVKEVLDKLITDFETLESTVDGLSAEVSDLEDPDADIEVLEEEVKDLRNSVIDIIAVLRNLKFYSEYERIHALTVLADPDYTKAPTQTLVNISPAVKFSNSLVQNMYVNFAIPKNIDLTEAIVCNFIYCVDTSATGYIKVDYDVQNLAAGENLMTAALASSTTTLTPPVNAYQTASYVGTDFSFVPTANYNLVNIRISRDTTVASNHSGNFYLLDLSFFGKRLPVNLVTI